MRWLKKDILKTKLPGLLLAASLLGCAPVPAGAAELTNLHISAWQGVRIGPGNTNERSGELRYDAATGHLELHNGTAWIPLASNLIASGTGDGFPLTNDANAAQFSITNIDEIVANILNATNQLIFANLPWQIRNTTNDSGHVYYSNSIVTYNGSMYRAGIDIRSSDFFPNNPDCGAGTNNCVYPTPGNPGTGTNWIPVAAKGDTGATGSGGSDGLDGLDGVGNIQYGIYDSLKTYSQTSGPIVVSYDGQWYDFILTNATTNATATGATPSLTTNTWAVSVAKGTSGTLVGTNLTFLGSYDAGITYTTMQAVSYQGSSFYKDTTNPATLGIAPTAYTTGAVNSYAWTVLAGKGDKGDAGATGPAGVDGAITTTIVYYVVQDAGVDQQTTNNPSSTQRLFQFTETDGGGNTNFYAWLGTVPVGTNSLLSIGTNLYIVSGTSTSLVGGGGGVVTNVQIETVTTADIANWDTAYGWGDHGAAGYSTGTPVYVETNYGVDVVFGTNNAAEGQVLMWDTTAVAWVARNVTEGSTLVTNETDPVWTASDLYKNDGGALTNIIAASTLVTLTPTNATFASQDVEAALVGIDSALASASGGLTAWTEGTGTTTQAGSYFQQISPPYTNSALFIGTNDAITIGIPDGTAIGGDARSTASVDLQMPEYRNSASMIAGGQERNVLIGTYRSTISGGEGNVILGGKASSGNTISGAGDGNAIIAPGAGGAIISSSGNGNLIAAGGGSQTISAGSQSAIIADIGFSTISGTGGGNIILAGYDNDITGTAAGAVIAGGRYSRTTYALIFGQGSTILTHYRTTNTAEGTTSIGAYIDNAHRGSVAIADITSSTDRWQTTATNQMIIRMQNGVGINTNNPSESLHVSGNIRVDGNIWLGTNAYLAVDASTTNLLFITISPAVTNQVGLTPL